MELIKANTEEEVGGHSKSQASIYTNRVMGPQKWHSAFLDSGIKYKLSTRVSIVLIVNVTAGARVVSDLPVVCLGPSLCELFWQFLLPTGSVFLPGQAAAQAAFLSLLCCHGPGAMTAKDTHTIRLDKQLSINNSSSLVVITTLWMGINGAWVSMRWEFKC